MPKGLRCNNSNNIDYRSNDENYDNVGGMGGGGMGGGGRRRINKNKNK